MTTIDLTVSDTEPDEAGKAPVTLSGARCQCPSCSLYFNSDKAFCKHRVGRHMPMQRRCLSETEMMELGMALVGSFWVSECREAKTIPPGPRTMPLYAVSRSAQAQTSDAPDAPAALLATDSSAFAFGPHGARGLP